MLLEWRIAVARQLAVATAVARTVIIEPILDGIYMAKKCVYGEEC